MSLQSEERNKEIIDSVKDWIKSIGIAIGTTMFVTTFIFNTAVVKGDSMNPTLEDNDRLIVKKYETLLNTEEYRRGDLIVFESPVENNEKYFIKRVIGLPGDKINILEGNLYINDVKIEEPYIDKDSYTEPLIHGIHYIVSENELFVMGDNRFPNKSNDSRSFGSVSQDNVEGKIVLRFLPLDKIDIYSK